MILKICERSKAEICFGLEGQEMPDLEMAVVESADAFTMTGRCPFSGKAGGQCPFSGGQSSVVLPPSRALDIVEAQNASAHEHGATMQPRDEIIKQPSGLPGAPMAGRLLGNVLQEKLDNLLNEDPDHCCPVSFMLLHHPAVASDGFIYEEASLKQLLANRQVSPMTREVLKPTYRFVESKQAEVSAFRSQRSEELLEFAAEAAAQQQGLALAALERIADYIEPIYTAPAQGTKYRAAQIYAQLGRAVPPALQRCQYFCISDE
jgi:hypothetical protein